MQILRTCVVIDAPNVDEEAAFWAQLLGGEVRRRFMPAVEWRDVIVEGRRELAVQHAPDHVAPEWPPRSASAQRQQLHYDVYVEKDDVEEACERVIELGAESLQPPEDPDADQGFHVFKDPAGHPFCICWD